MRGAHKAKEMKRRASQRRATHRARQIGLMLGPEERMAVVETRKGKPKVGFKRPAKPSVKKKSQKK